MIASEAKSSLASPAEFLAVDESPYPALLNLGRNVVDPGMTPRRTERLHPSACWWKPAPGPRVYTNIKECNASGVASVRLAWSFQTSPSQDQPGSRRNNGAARRLPRLRAERWWTEALITTVRKRGRDSAESDVFLCRGHRQMSFPRFQSYFL